MDPSLQIAFLTLCYILRRHQVVCGSKYLVRGESALDHVDLLVSSRHWPPVYVVDMATPVALCADLCYPELTNQMWGRNQGCFSSPTEPPVVRSILRNWDPTRLTVSYSLVLRAGLPASFFLSTSVLSQYTGTSIYATNLY